MLEIKSVTILNKLSRMSSLYEYSKQMEAIVIKKLIFLLLFNICYIFFLISTRN